MIHQSFIQVLEEATYVMKTRSHLVHTEKWQGVDIVSKPEMATHEVLMHSFQCQLASERLEWYQKSINPNLPWADDHFEERVCGEPLNPGVEWANWPYAHSADKFRDKFGQFNHNYMERYWPKWAGHTDAGRLEADRAREVMAACEDMNYGIRYRYGDLNDVVALLAAQPLTRQAYLPVWFPEDTGVVHGERAPCTLGYHFIVRRGQLHCIYYIRSCDFVRHFRDDIYLTVRLQLWVLNKLRFLDPKWVDVKPGIFQMHITSLHCFRNDWPTLFPNVLPPLEA